MTDPALTEEVTEKLRIKAIARVLARQAGFAADVEYNNFTTEAKQILAALGPLSAPAENERDWNGLAALPNDMLYKALLAGSADADMQKDAADWIERLMRWRDARLPRTAGTPAMKHILTDEMIEALIERVAKAKHGDWQIDRDIFRLSHPEYKDYVEGRGGLIHPNDSTDMRVLADIRWPNYTFSIDAAVALMEKVLPGAAKRLHFAFDPDPVFGAEIFSRAGERFVGDAKNMPLAIVLATLRALQQKAKPNELRTMQRPAMGL